MLRYFEVLLAAANCELKTKSDQQIIDIEVLLPTSYFEVV